MSDENKEILEQVTELISSKKENVKGTNIKKIDNQAETRIENKENNDLKTEAPTDSLIRSELRKWINKNAEQIAKDIIKENAKKIFK
jgi:predicted metal-dependent hydrolase